MREQLLEGEPALRRMSARAHQLEARVRWRAVHVFERFAQCRQAELACDFGGQPIGQRAIDDFTQRERGELPQAALLNALGQRIDGRQRLHLTIHIATHAPILGMHDFQPERAAAKLSVTAQAHAARQRLLLRR